MSCRKGLTSWVFRAGKIGIAYRWNMKFGQMLHTFCVHNRCKGCHMVECGPIILEWL